MKKKIVLFQPAGFSSVRFYHGAPLALLSISRILDKEGYDIKIITPWTSKNYLNDIVSETKGAICFGVTAITGYAIHDGLLVSKAVKQKYPKIPIIWGGWHPSILPQETAMNENVDIVVKGQGERTFTELVHGLEKNISLKDIKGIVYKDKKGKIIENQDRPLESLDNFPVIPYHLIDVEKYLMPQEYGKRSLTYFSSYGCPHRCIFCVENIVNKRHWVGLSPEKAAEEINHLKGKYNLDSVQIIDSNFFINEERAERFAKKLLELKTDIKWGNVNGRTRQMSLYKENTWKLMKESGLSCILVGAESGDDKTLKYMHKDITIKDTVRLAKICAKYNIKILTSFLVGFPKYSDIERCHQSVDKEINSSFELIEKMFAIFPRIRMMFALYLPYPSSGLFEQSKKLGLDLPDNLEGWSQYLIAAEEIKGLKVRQKWVTDKQAQKILIASIYIFFFLDPDSFDLVTGKINNDFFKKVLFVGFIFFKTISTLRWKYKYFGFPIDFYFYNKLRKYSQLG